MIKSSLLTSSLGVLGMLVMLSCEEPVKPVAGPAVTDIDGNVYPSVVIGLQTWMARDLVVTRYNEGSQIPWIQDPESWQYLTAGAYCIRPGLEPHIGALYNKYAVDTYRLAPVGWHIPSHTELMILLDYLGGQNVAGEKIRSRTGW